MCNSVREQFFILNTCYGLSMMYEIHFFYFLFQIHHKMRGLIWDIGVNKQSFHCVFYITFIQFKEKAVHKLSEFWMVSSCVSHVVLGSSSFESQKMERPSISVISPTSPGALRDAPQVLPGQLSVSIFCFSWGFNGNLWSAGPSPLHIPKVYWEAKINVQW